MYDFSIVVFGDYDKDKQCTLDSKVLCIFCMRAYWQETQFDYMHVKI